VAKYDAWVQPKYEPLAELLLTDDYDRLRPHLTIGEWENKQILSEADWLCWVAGVICVRPQRVRDREGHGDGYGEGPEGGGETMTPRQANAGVLYAKLRGVLGRVSSRPAGMDA
jgi:hypothetical protein